MLASNRKFRLMLVFATVLMLLFSFGCESQDNALNSESMTDGETIQAIQNSPNTLTISVSELPGSAVSSLDQDFAECFINSAYKVDGLGYEVNMRQIEGAEIGTCTSVYLNDNGRRLGIVVKGKGGNSDNPDNRRGPHRCFDFVYPVTYLMPDGTEITGDSQVEIRDAFRTWYEANPDVLERPVLQFPVTIVLEDETTVVINDAEEMHAAVLEYCGTGGGGGHGGGGDRPGGPLSGTCFDLVYPVTMIMPDETTITGNSAEELHELIQAWHLANPDIEDRPVLQFPVDVVLEDGSTLTFNSQEEVRAAVIEYCDNGGGQGGGGHGGQGGGGDRPGGPLSGTCFDLVYPVTMIMPDETTITGNSAEELHELIQAWHLANPDIEGRPVLQFPVDVILEDGSTLTFNSQEEVRAAVIEYCDNGGGQGGGGHGGQGGGGEHPGGPLSGTCFDLVYPVTMIMPDETTITGNSAEELHELVQAWHLANPDVIGRPALQFPVDVILEDGSTLTINSQEEMQAAVAEYCDGGHQGGGHGGNGGEGGGHGGGDHGGEGGGDHGGGGGRP